MSDTLTKHEMTMKLVEHSVASLHLMAEKAKQEGDMQQWRILERLAVMGQSMMDVKSVNFDPQVFPEIKTHSER